MIVARWVGAGVLVVASSCLVGCHDETGVDPAPADVTGEWSGTWSNDDGSSGGLLVNLVQEGSTITGTLLSADCFSDLSILAERDGDGATSGRTIDSDLRFQGVFKGQSASGTYAADATTCAGVDPASGTWTMKRGAATP